MAFVTDAGTLIVDDGSDAVLVENLIPSRLIKVEVVGASAPPGSTGTPGLVAGVFTDYSWEYYNAAPVVLGQPPLEYVLDPGESLVLFGLGNADAVEVAVYYEGESAEVDLYEQKAIIPAAVSSQLDVTGEERIHIAPWIEVLPAPEPPPPSDCALVVLAGEVGDGIRLVEVTGLPDTWSFDIELFITTDEPDPLMHYSTIFWNDDYQSHVVFDPGTFPPSGTGYISIPVDDSPENLPWYCATFVNEALD